MHELLQVLVVNGLVSDIDFVRLFVEEVVGRRLLAGTDYWLILLHSILPNQNHHINNGCNQTVGKVNDLHVVLGVFQVEQDASGDRDRQHDGHVVEGDLLDVALELRDFSVPEVNAVVEGLTGIGTGPQNASSSEEAIENVEEVVVGGNSEELDLAQDVVLLPHENGQHYDYVAQKEQSDEHVHQRERHEVGVETPGACEQQVVKQVLIEGQHRGHEVE